MSWKTPQEHIAAHCRSGKWDESKTVAGNLSEHSLLCIVGMIETGEVNREDVEAIGGPALWSAVDSQLAQSAATFANLLILKIAKMSPENRVKLWDEIEDGYCRHCGRDKPCQCMNDE